ncbi:hypothetical protein MUY27_14575 [Mucilaginibacter sp. RS28]|uniref:Uncharacterized protein n=1 Tax=Mucilaginibacter straminoryzae TaxID=2932774 RepID=A0A9X1X6B8_9SPHI|nr:hypothetical protein [Mucilaginibacter straminoryzae]MCJ8210940.1 hypothetical protein [Mucilaginibacter straminoryzae]
MKKLIYLLLLTAFTTTAVMAQTTVVTKNETKTKRTSTLPQKVHNIFHKKKKYSGTKTKHVVRKAKV